ncbi:DUF1501 domain-containing protein, partial [Singulisphaera rosea]
MSDRLIVPNGMSRRHFLGHMASSAMAVPAMHFLGALEANAQQVPKKTKSCILLWMGGGPSHMDTWNLKPDSEKNGGPFRPISTSASGVSICEHLPNVAKQMKHLSVVRSLNSKEGNHDRGTYMMHTGYAPNPTVVHSSFGSSFAYELASKHESLALPHCISINGPGVGAGFLGMAYSPFVVANPNGKIANLAPPAGIDDDRMNRRLEMLSLVEQNFKSQRRGQAGADHYAVYSKTVRMMKSPATKASLSLDSESAAVR